MSILWDEEGKDNGKITFDQVAAHKFTYENRCELWMMNADGRLGEVVNSEWLKSIAQSRPPAVTGELDVDLAPLRHFLLSFKGYGCHEIATARWGFRARPAT